MTEDKWDIIAEATEKAMATGVSDKELKHLVDEYMLQWYVYGHFERADPCLIYELVSKHQTAQTKFNTKFLTTLIRHLSMCEKCHFEYIQSSTGSAKNE